MRCKPVIGILFSLLIIFDQAHLGRAASDVPINLIISQDQEHQCVTQFGNGSLVFVYEDESVTNNQILMRRFDVNLLPSGGESRVNVQTNGECITPVVAPLTGGGFVVAYAVRNLDADSYAIAFRRYDANASPLDATDVPANTISASAQFHPQVAPLTNSGFVLTWVGTGGVAGDTSQNVFYRRFGANGSALDGAEIRANGLGNDAVSGGDQGRQSVVTLRDGSFVIVYEDRASDDLYGVRISHSGVPLNAPGESPGNFQFQINSPAAYEQTAPAVAALTNGGFVVTYNTETNGTAASRRVLARVFGANGVGGTEFQVGSHVNRWQDSRVIGLPNGDFVVTWQAVGEGADAISQAWSVFEQRFSPAGLPRFAPFMVNTWNTNDQDVASLAAFNNSGYVIAWKSFAQDTSRDGVFARAFLPNNEIPGALTLRAFPQSNSVTVRFAGQAGREHQLQRSTNLTTWTGVLTTNSATGVFEYHQPYPGSPHFFFRVQSL